MYLVGFVLRRPVPHMVRVRVAKRTTSLAVQYPCIASLQTLKQLIGMQWPLPCLCGQRGCISPCTMQYPDSYCMVVA